MIKTKYDFQEAVKAALPKGWRSLSETDLATDIWPIVEAIRDQAYAYPATSARVTLASVKAKRRARVQASGTLPYRLRPIWQSFTANIKDATLKTFSDLNRELRRNFPAAVKNASDTAKQARTALSNWWARAFGRGEAWDEGRDTALANAAMVASDMGYPDVRKAINHLMPDGSPFIPFDDPRYKRPG
jgi:hypothetical protein